jgi:hypothetical protein
MPWFSFQLQVGNNEGARRRLHMYSQFLLQNGISEVRLYVPRTSQEDGILPSTKAPGSISSATEDASSGSSTTTLVSKGIKATEKSNSESLEETNGNDGYVRIALYSSTPKSVDEWLRIYHIVNSQPQMMQSKDSTSIIEISSPLTGPPVGTSAISGKTAQIRKIPGTGGDSFNKEGNLTASSEVMKLSTSGVSESSQDSLNKPVSSSTGSSSDGTSTAAGSAAGHQRVWLSTTGWLGKCVPRQERLGNDCWYPRSIQHGIVPWQCKGGADGLAICSSTGGAFDKGGKRAGWTDCATNPYRTCRGESDNDPFE